MEDKSMVVSIRNYQRIKKASFKFVPGLNVIVGPSNNGKSSTLRAITTALFNLSKDSHVTVGETVSAVGIRYRGHDVVWKRDLSLASKNSYKIDGKTFNKLGRGQPPEVAEALGIFEVDLDDTRERLNFQKQMAYPFLLDRTPSQVFKFMAQSAEEDNLMAIIDQMKTDQNSIAASIKANQAAMDSIKVALVREKTAFDAIKGKAKVCQAIIQMDSVVKRFTDLENRLGHIDGLENVRVSAKADLVEVEKRLPSLISVLDDTGPTIILATALESAINSISGYQNVMLSSKQSMESYEEKLESFGDMPSADVFSEMSQIWAIYSQGQQALSERNLQDENAQVLGHQISRIDTKLELLSQTISSVEEMQKEMVELDSVIMRVREQHGQCEDYSMQIRALQDMLDVVQSDINSYVVCPYCGSDLRREEHGEH